MNRKLWADHLTLLDRTQFVDSPSTCPDIEVESEVWLQDLRDIAKCVIGKMEQQLWDAAIHWTGMTTRSFFEVGMSFSWMEWNR